MPSPLMYIFLESPHDLQTLERSNSLRSLLKLRLRNTIQLIGQSKFKNLWKKETLAKLDVKMSKIGSIG